MSHADRATAAASSASTSALVTTGACADAQLYLSTSETAKRLHVCDQTLRTWRKTGSGPRYVRFGARILYRLVDLETFEAARTFSSHAEERAAAPIAA